MNSAVQSLHKKSVKDILEHFPELAASAVGAQDLTAHQMTSLEQPKKSSISFCLKPDKLPQSCEKMILLWPVKAPIPKTLSSINTFVLSPNPELLMREIKNKWFAPTPYRDKSYSGIHPTAVIGNNCSIDETVTIAPYAVIGSHVTIKKNSHIGPHAVIESKVIIGVNTTLHAHSYVGYETQVGNHCEILPHATVGSEGYGYAHDQNWNHYRIPHTGPVILEDDVHIGSGSCVDKGTLLPTYIRKGTKVDNLCHFAHNSDVGQNSLITAQFGMAGSTKIGRNFVTGGNTSVTGHIEITDNVQIAGRSGVTKSIKEAGQYGGFPLQPLQKYLKTKAALLHLNDLRASLKKVLKKLDL